jgi:hypothetical protein
MIALRLQALAWGSLCVLVAVSGPVAAKVIVERPLTEAAPTAATLPKEPYLIAVRPLKHLGTPSAKVAGSVLRGEEKNASFAQALKKIVPAGWKGYIADPRIRAIKTASWQGNGRSWVVVLEEFLMQNGLVATLDWDAREVTVEPGPSFVRQ